MWALNEVDFGWVLNGGDFGWALNGEVLEGLRREGEREEGRQQRKS